MPDLLAIQATLLRNNLRQSALTVWKPFEERKDWKKKKGRKQPSHDHIRPCGCRWCVLCWRCSKRHGNPSATVHSSGYRGGDEVTDTLMTDYCVQEKQSTSYDNSSHHLRGTSSGGSDRMRICDEKEMMKMMWESVFESRKTQRWALSNRDATSTVIGGRNRETATVGKRFFFSELLCERHKVREKNRWDRLGMKRFRKIKIKKNSEGW